MTTYTPFTPSAQAPFQFDPTLDGQTYSAVIKWNVHGQRWYMELRTLTGGLVFNQALIASPDGYDINLAGPYFKTSTLIYRGPTQQFEVTP